MMTVNINDVDALERIVQVECYGMDDKGKREFRERQLIQNEPSFAEFKSKFDSLSAERRSQLHYVSVDSISAIYGIGNWHRYFVRGTGEIIFSRNHSHTEGQARASAAGFTIG